jgi:hypothetical protein
LRHKKYIRAYRELFSSAWAQLFPQNNWLIDFDWLYSKNQGAIYIRALVKTNHGTTENHLLK